VGYFILSHPAYKIQTKKHIANVRIVALESNYNTPATSIKYVT